MKHLDASKAPKQQLSQPRILRDKFNRVIKTEEDYRIGMRRGADGRSRWYRNGKLIREEKPRQTAKEKETAFRTAGLEKTTKQQTVPVVTVDQRSRHISRPRVGMTL